MSEQTKNVEFVKLYTERPLYGNGMGIVQAILKEVHAAHFNGAQGCEWTTNHDLNLIICWHGLGVPLSLVKMGAGIERN